MEPRNKLGKLTPGADGTGLRENFKFSNELALLGEIQSRIGVLYNLQGREPDNVVGKVARHHVNSRTLVHTDWDGHLSGYFRTNLLIQEADTGGEFEFNGNVVPLPANALVAFGAAAQHGVRLVTSGTRIVIMFGWKDQ